MVRPYSSRCCVHFTDECDDIQVQFVKLKIKISKFIALKKKTFYSTTLDMYTYINPLYHVF